THGMGDVLDRRDLVAVREDLIFALGGEAPDLLRPLHVGLHARLPLPAPTDPVCQRRRAAPGRGLRSRGSAHACPSRCLPAVRIPSAPLSTYNRKHVEV